MERNIGEIFEFGGDWYQCVKSYNCRECSHFTTECSSGIKSDLANKVFGECSKTRRSDNKSVIFKKLEKVGEPYFNGQYGEVLQEYKYYIPPITPDLRIHIIKLGIVGIEIKQNKEDMEEYEMHDAREDIPEFDKVVDECLFGKQELKLKPFDLQKAKAGKPVCTRDGRKARIICFDYNGETGDYPIVALVHYNKRNKCYERVLKYTSDGLFNKYGDCQHDDDLMMLPEKKEGWVNVYKDSVYDTKDEALIGRSKNIGYIDTVKIEWEE